MTRRSNPLAFRRALGLIACIAVTATVLTVGATPAAAALCQTPGHAYLTQPGRVYLSGYDGDEQFGVPVVEVLPGAQFRLGGNGINPNTRIEFEAFDKTTGQDIDFITGQSTYFTAPARTNCVVHEEGPFRVTAPRGTYIIRAIYEGGNAGTDITDRVAEVVVLI